MSDPTKERCVDDASLRACLKSQYHAALAMLKEAIERCPDESWDAPHHHNACWQVAYHALFFAHCYAQPDANSFQPWSGQQSNVQHPDAIAGPPDPESDLPLLPRPYTKAEVLDYWDFCDANVDRWVDALDLSSPASGFYWYPISKLEHQIVNLRHVAHHAGQLIDRVRADAGAGVRWVGARSEADRAR